MLRGIDPTVDQLSEMREKEEFIFLGTPEKNLAFHLGGHVNDSVFWTNVSPDGGDKPAGALAARIDADFGSGGTSSTGRTCSRASRSR